VLKEIPYVRQVEGELRRRWFEDEYFDLIIWSDDKDEIVEFELCYDKHETQRALRWQKPDRYGHFRVDDGENRAGRGKASPVLVRDMRFSHEKVLAYFELASAGLEYRVVKLVLEKVLHCPLRKTFQRNRLA